MLMLVCSLLKTHESPSEKQIEEGLVGNICRCTGYRPILDAMKSFSEAAEDVRDIEDLSEWVQVCPMVSAASSPSCKLVQRGDKVWFSPRNLSSMFDYINTLAEETEYKLVAGNTAQGVYEDITSAAVLIDVTRVQELRHVSKSPLEIGAAVSITDTVTHFRTVMENAGAQYSYLQVIVDSLVYVASPALKDVGTWAGNLMVKHEYPGFPSDLFSMLEAVGGKVKVARMENSTVKTELVSPGGLLKLDMKNKVIQSIVYPELTSDHRFQYYKVSPRTAYSHAHVNAAFLAELDTTGKQFVSKPSFVYGGIAFPSAEFYHAEEAEASSVGVDLTDSATLQKLLKMVDDSVDADDDQHEGSADFRKGLASSLLYKFMLHTFAESGAVSDNRVCI